jgi:poly(A) polymerase
MNAIAINAEDRFDVRDPFGGIEDISHKIVRAVGNVHERFNEDKLRVFRGLRFAVEKGFTLDPETASVMLDVSRDISGFDAVSTERIREELLKMFVCDWEKSFWLLDAFGLSALVKSRDIWFKPTLEKR